MAQAQYRVHIPVTDDLRQPLSRHLPIAAHQWLHSAQPRLFEGSWVEGPHTHVHRRGEPQEAHHLVTVAEDSPETDSYIKQLAAHVGEVANHPGISAMKTGPKGTEHWIVPNRNYMEGWGADPTVLEQPAV